MLLSADWFAPYWRNFGLVLSESECALVREVARGVVRDLMKGADVYWNINFSEQRVSQTIGSFIEGVKGTGLSNAGRMQIADLLASAGGDAESVTTTLWLFGALMDQLVSAAPSMTPPKVAATTLPIVRSLWANGSAPDDISDQLERAARTSNSEWDRYLRALTPDLPTLLSDWASNTLQRPDNFRRFWAQLFWVVSKDDRQGLRQWFESEAIKVADPSYVLATPDWMRTE
jgi:hypothetical protein